MSQKTVNVLLCSPNETEDILKFSFSDDTSYEVNLNSQECQNELKTIFSMVLQQLIENDLIFELSFEEGYSRKMYIEVCQEYIKDLNREIDSIKDKFRELIF